MRKFSLPILLFGLTALACRLASGTPTASTPSATASPSPLPSAVPTLLPSLTPTLPGQGVSSPTPETPPDHKGYIIHFGQQASSGMATLGGTILTCSGRRGPWKGDLRLSFLTTGMELEGAGPIQFYLPEGRSHAEGEVQLSASGTGGNQQCILQVEEPLKFVIDFSPDWQSAQLIIGSTGAGLITIGCPKSPPATIPFAAFWGPEPIILPVSRYEGCP